MNEDDIESTIAVPNDIELSLVLYLGRQTSDRGDWPDPRPAEQPLPPWPDENNPMLRYLLWKADACLHAGMTPKTALVNLAVHAWFEGGIENYDRGRRDGARGA